VVFSTTGSDFFDLSSVTVVVVVLIVSVTYSRTGLCFGPTDYLLTSSLKATTAVVSGERYAISVKDDFVSALKNAIEASTIFLVTASFVTLVPSKAANPIDVYFNLEASANASFIPLSALASSFTSSPS